MVIKETKFNIRTFNKAQNRVLCERLEHYYAHLLVKYERIKSGQFVGTKSQLEAADRKLRVKLKSCEILLISLNSKLFENVHSVNSKQTRKIEGRLHGTV